MPQKEHTFRGILHSLGLVFGDIGTSPIYTLTVVFLIMPPTESNIIGVLSIIIWTLISLVTIQYAWLAMSLSHRGEGGTIVLKEILASALSSKRGRVIVTAMAVLGVSLLIGDGVITPAISILSAVEGAVLIPGLESLHTSSIVLISGFIAFVLFSVQRKGTDAVAGAFGPLMILWFAALTIFGLISIIQAPVVLKAVNPYYAYKFIADNRMAGFIALGEIILCATGGEALYADMGHLGRRPIAQAWSGVFFALVVNYLGQGAFLLSHPNVKNVLFEMVFHYGRPLYMPFLLLSIMATIIASQAMISGMFSIVFQGITTRLMPMFKVDFTSSERKSQIYIGSVNWFLLLAVLFIMVEFRESSKLAAAYGLAVTGTMTLTGIMMAWIFHLKKKPWLMAMSVVLTVIDMAYLTSNFYKLPHGGYWSLVIASIPLGMIVLYTEGQKQLYKIMVFMKIEDFLHKFTRVYSTTERIKGTSLFLLKNTSMIPFYITQTMFFHGIIYEDNIFVSIVNRDDPYGVIGFFSKDLAPGLRVFEIQAGYMEMIDVEGLLREAAVEERVVFYGLENISSDNPIWKSFSLIKRITPTFIQFYNFPTKKLHGVLTRIGM